MSDYKETLKDKAVDYIQKEGFFVFEAKVFFANKRLIIKLLVDFKEGGVSLDDCSSLNRKLSEYIEKEDLLQGPYLVEVSSPGIKREFSRQKDFLRIKGRFVDVWLNEPLEEKLHYGGKILEVFNDKVVIDEEGRNINIPVSLVRKAKQRIV